MLNTNDINNLLQIISGPDLSVRGNQVVVVAQLQQKLAGILQAEQAKQKAPVEAEGDHSE